MTNERKNWILPEQYHDMHDLCFLIHDIMVQFLVSGERDGIFKASVPLKNHEEAASIGQYDDIFEWLEQTGRRAERANILKAVVLPAILSDMLHNIYEALETSRKGKLNVAYALVRKPIQENLFVLESIVIDDLDFSEKLASNPLLLRPKNAGGIEGHAKRSAAVIAAIGGHASYLDPNYIAQLRYEKCDDGFDGVCNKAIHLFTEHHAIRTEIMNINFIFSDYDAKLSQWSYLYSRLPYILYYAYLIVEHIGGQIARTYPEYLNDMARRIGAQIMLWDRGIHPEYRNIFIDSFSRQMGEWLEFVCKQGGSRPPNIRDIRRMANTGALPGESARSVKGRVNRYLSYITSNS